MAFPLALLKLLSDGLCHSGESLGEALGMSRAGAWKQIQSLRQQGVEIDAVTGEGYRLPQPLELLDADSLQARLGAVYPHAQLIYAPVLGSSNQRVREHIEQQGLEHPVLALCEYQEQGRGRRGRSWQAGFAQGVLLSVAMRVPCPAVQLGGLSLACGVEVAKALQLQGVSGLQLKWPNDLLLGTKKLGGILIELSGETEGPCDVIVGLGLNVGAAPEGLGGDSLGAAHLPGFSRKQLTQLCAEALLRVLCKYAQQGFGAWQSDWQALHAHQGREVIIKQHQGDIAGVCLGVDGQGALRLATAAGEQAFFAGDVSLRGAL